MIAAGPGRAPFELVVPMAPAELTTMPSVARDFRIRAESIVWLTTVSADGRPHILPIWFGWDGRTFLVFPKPGAKKVRNVRSNPAVMLALGDPAADFDVLLIEGLAYVLDPPASDLVPAPSFHAYTEPMAALGLSRDE